jgi:hypothetical protein
VISSGLGSSFEDRAGLCGRCVHARIVTNDRGSQFLRCHYATIDPRYPKYPRLPVLACAAFTERVDGADGSG